MKTCHTQFLHPQTEMLVFYTVFPHVGPLPSVPWSPRPQNAAVAATCGRGRWEFLAILRVTPEIASDCDFFCGWRGEKPSAISATEWLRARLGPPWSLRFCNASFAPLRTLVWGQGQNAILWTSALLWSAGQRTPLAGSKGGEGNLMKDTPPKRGFRTPNHLATPSVALLDQKLFSDFQKVFSRVPSLVLFYFWCTGTTLILKKIRSENLGSNIVSQDKATASKLF